MSHPLNSFSTSSSVFGPTPLISTSSTTTTTTSDSKKRKDNPVVVAEEEKFSSEETRAKRVKHEAEQRMAHFGTENSTIVANFYRDITDTDAAFWEAAQEFETKSEGSVDVSLIRDMIISSINGGQSNQEISDFFNTIDLRLDSMPLPELLEKLKKEMIIIQVPEETQTRVEEIVTSLHSKPQIVKEKICTEIGGIDMGVLLQLIKGYQGEGQEPEDIVQLITTYGFYLHTVPLVILQEKFTEVMVHNNISEKDQQTFSNILKSCHEESLINSALFQDLSNLQTNLKNLREFASLQKILIALKNADITINNFLLPPDKRPSNWIQECDAMLQTLSKFQTLQVYLDTDFTKKLLELSQNDSAISNFISYLQSQAMMSEINKISKKIETLTSYKQEAALRKAALLNKKVSPKEELERRFIRPSPKDPYASAKFPNALWKATLTLLREALNRSLSMGNKQLREIVKKHKDLPKNLTEVNDTQLSLLWDEYLTGDQFATADLSTLTAELFFYCTPLEVQALERNKEQSQEEIEKVCTELLQNKATALKLNTFAKFRRFLSSKLPK